MDIQRKIIFSAGSFVLFVLLYLIVFHDKGLVDLYDLRAGLDEAVRVNEEMNEKNRQLYYEIYRLKKDPEYLEYVARRELGMVAEDEIVVQFHTGGDL